MIDLLVIGGGVNGAGIARDAVGRGLSVTLCEKDDLAQHTSSASTKLIHGGLRYLEQFEFRLVRESLQEREVLLAAAPHIIWPLRFVLPVDKGMRPAWMLRAGLALYDTIGGRSSLPGTRGVALREPPHRNVLRNRLKRGFEYSDCWVEDSRLVVLTARDAMERGARIATRTRCVALERRADRWHATLHGPGGEETIEAKAVVNAAGPWVDDLAKLALGTGTPSRLRLVKGSHIVVPRKYPGDHAYIFQQPDNRIVFAIPFERHFTLIGTTDRMFRGDPDAVAISEDERTYLRDAAARYFKSGITEDEIVHSFAGVRPLYEDNSSRNSTVTRDYVFELDADGGAPILSIYGGKLTTYRRLAEHALAKLAHQLPMGAAWTRAAPLPGGDLEDFATFLWEAADRHPWVPGEMLLRLARAYGTRIDRILGSAAALDDLGEHFGGDLYEAELRHMVDAEFAASAEDAMWRRSKLGLHLPAEAQERVARWFADEAAREG